MSDLSGKHGLIVGVANKRSISWAIAQAAAAAGARIAMTYPSERLEENVRELAAKLEDPLVIPCDVTSDQQIADLAVALDREFGGLDFFLHGAAFAPAADLNNPFLQTSREGFRIALDVSASALIGLSRAVARLLQHSHADVSRQPARVHQLQRHGRRESRPRGLGPLSGERSWRPEHPRE